MPIFCVSDLHLCDRGFRDNFAVEGREARFYKFLDYVVAKITRPLPPWLPPDRLIAAG